MNSFPNLDFFDKQNEITAAEQIADESKAKEFDALFANFSGAPVFNAPIQENPEPISEAMKISTQLPQAVLSGEKPVTAMLPSPPPEKTSLNDSDTLTYKKLKVLTESAEIELKALTESFDESFVPDNTPPPSELNIKPDVSIDDKAPVKTPQNELPTAFELTKQPIEGININDERSDNMVKSDVLPSIQILSRSTNQDTVQFLPKSENLPSAANVPVKFKHLFRLGNPNNTEQQNLLPVSPAFAEALPKLNLNEPEILPTSASPKFLQRRLESLDENIVQTSASPKFLLRRLDSLDENILQKRSNSPDENIKAVNAPTSQKEPIFDLQPAGEQLKKIKSPSTKLSSDLPEILAAEFEKPIELTDKSPAPFFERLSIAEKNAAQIAEKLPALDVLKANVLEQIEKPLLEAVVLNAEVDKPEILKLRLRPAELGMVEVKLEKTDTNTIKIQFQTDTDATQQILAENFDQLKTTLENSGWRVEPMEIISNQFTSSGNEQQREQNAQQVFAENNLKGVTSFGSDADESGDSAENNANRLLSMRA